MPRYEYECPNHHRFHRVTSITQHESVKACETCWQPAPQIISAPLLVKVRESIAYDSPIDGRIITTWAERQEDLKRNGCREYDPEMKKDAARFRDEQDTALETAIEQTAEELVEKMPTKQRGKLMSEMTDQGLTLETVRSTA